MTEDAHKTSEPESQSNFNESTGCDICGRYGTFRFGDRKLCQECYEECGSCCPEFGKDDLWKFEDNR